MPLDEQGNLVDQTPGDVSAADVGAAAPPGYGEHILDQLYDDVDMSGFQTPAIQSGVSSPFYAQSRSGSSDNLPAGAHSAPVAPAALSSRLADVSLDPSQRNASYSSVHSVTASGMMSPGAFHHSAPRSEPQSAALTRSNSEEDESGRNSPDDVDIDMSEFAELNRVPSYATAVRTPANRSRAGTAAVPDYLTALSAPRTPPATDLTPDPLSTISEDANGESVARPSVLMSGTDTADHRRLHLLQARDQVV